MMRGRFSEGQIIGILKEQEGRGGDGSPAARRPWARYWR